jgi:hypothetical protein
MNTIRYLQDKKTFKLFLYISLILTFSLTLSKKTFLKKSSQLSQPSEEILISGSTCYELMEQNGEEFNFRSTIVGAGKGIIDLKLQYKVKCNIPGEFKIKIDKCLAHERISSGPMHASIQGTECLLINDAQLLEDEVTVLINPTNKPECNQMINTEFFVNVRTEFRGVLEMSPRCLIKSEESDSKVGCVHYVINSSAIKNLGCPQNFPITVGFKTYQDMKVVDIINFEISKQVSTQQHTF